MLAWYSWETYWCSIQTMSSRCKARERMDGKSFICWGPSWAKEGEGCRVCFISTSLANSYSPRCNPALCFLQAHCVSESCYFLQFGIKCFNFFCCLKHFYFCLFVMFVHIAMKRVVWLRRADGIYIGARQREAWLNQCPSYRQPLSLLGESTNNTKSLI